MHTKHRDAFFDDKHVSPAAREWHVRYMRDLDTEVFVRKYLFTYHVHGMSLVSILPRESVYICMNGGYPPRLCNNDRSRSKRCMKLSWKFFQAGGRLQEKERERRITLQAVIIQQRRWRNEETLDENNLIEARTTTCASQNDEYAMALARHRKRKNHAPVKGCERS